jgi:hypothetical protein
MTIDENCIIEKDLQRNCAEYGLQTLHTPTVGSSGLKLHISLSVTNNQSKC